MRAFAAVCCLAAAVAQAYPISPNTLWDLAGKADAIVVAAVVEFHDPPAQPSSFKEAVTRTEGRPRSRVRLRVSEVLKGGPISEVDVVTRASWVCPAPPRFIQGRTMLVFLSADEGRWQVTALSYGVLYPREDELPIFKSLINRAATLQQTVFTEKQRTEWAVEAASHRATRWHGVYELLSRSDRPRAHYDRKRRQQTTLTRAQQAVLAAGFIAEPSADRATPGIIQLLEGHDAPGLEAALVGAIDVLAEEESSMTPDAIRAFIKRKKGDPAAFISEVWARVRAKFSLPAGAVVPHHESFGAGEDTPF